MAGPGTRAADLELRGITKRFGHLTALAGVDLTGLRRAGAGHPR